MFERVQAYPEYMIDDRKGMHMAHRLVSCVKNRLGEEKQDTLSQQPLNINSSQAVRIRFGTSPSQKNKRRDEGEVPRAASCASASLPRVKGFPGGNCRQERAEGHSVRPRRWKTSRRQSREGKSEHGRRK